MKVEQTNIQSNTLLSDRAAFRGFKPDVKTHTFILQAAFSVALRLYFAQVLRTLELQQSALSLQLPQRGLDSLSAVHLSKGRDHKQRERDELPTFSCIRPSLRKRLPRYLILWPAFLNGWWHSWGERESFSEESTYKWVNLTFYSPVITRCEYALPDVAFLLIYKRKRFNFPFTHISFPNATRELLLTCTGNRYRHWYKTDTDETSLIKYECAQRQLCRMGCYFLLWKRN